MARIATLEAVITAKDEFTKQLAPINASLETFGKSATSIGIGLGKLAVPLGLLQREAINSAISFDEVATSVQATAKAGGAAAEEYEKLRGIALEFGKRGLFSATEVSEAMLDMVRDGLDPATIAGGRLQAVYDLAGASGETLADTQVALSDTMQAFKLASEDASRTVDVFAGVLFNTPAVLSELGTTMKTAAPAAATLGASLEDLAVVTGIMADSGIRGSDAGTALRRGLLNLAAPAKGAAEAIAGLGLSAEDAELALADMDIDAAAAQETARKLGISVFDSEGKFAGLVNVVKQLRSATKGMSDEQRILNLSQIFGARAVGAWSTLMNATNEELADMEEAVRRTGVATEIATDRANSMSGTMKQMQASLENAKIAFVEANSEGLVKFAETVKRLANAFANLDPSVKKFIFNAITVLVVLAPALIIIGQMALGLSALIKGFIAIAAVIKVATVAVGGLTLAAGIWVAAIAAVIAIGFLLFKHWDKVKAVAIKVWGAVTDYISDKILLVMGVIDKWVERFNKVVAAVTEVKDKVVDVVGGMVSSIADSVGGAADTVAQTTSGWADNIGGAMQKGLRFVEVFTQTSKDLWAGNAEDIKMGFEVAGQEFGIFGAKLFLFQEAVINAVKGAGNALLQFGKDTMNFFVGLVALALDALIPNWEAKLAELSFIAEAKFAEVKLWISTALAEIRNGFAIWFAEIVADWQAKWQMVTDFITYIWEVITNVFMVTWEAIKLVFTLALDFITDYIQQRITFWQNIFMAGFNFLKETLTTIWEGIKAVFGAALQFITDLLTPFIETTKEAWQMFWDSLKEIVFGVVEDVKGSVSGVFNFISEKVEAALNKLKELAAAAGSAASGVGAKIGGFVSGVVERGRQITGVNDAVIDPSGRIISTDPNDFLIATKNPAGLGGGGLVVNITGNTIVGGDADSVANAIGDALIQRLNMNMKF